MIFALQYGFSLSNQQISKNFCIHFLSAIQRLSAPRMCQLMTLRKSRQQPRESFREAKVASQSFLLSSRWLPDDDEMEQF